MKNAAWSLLACASAAACSGSPTTGVPNTSSTGQYRIQDGYVFDEDMNLGPVSKVLGTPAQGSATDLDLEIQSVSKFDESRGLTESGYTPWPGATVYWQWAAGSNTTGTVAGYLFTAMLDWTAMSPINFVQTTNPYGQGTLTITTNPAVKGAQPNCNSGVGAGNYNLNAGDCGSATALMHELGHAIGFVHEQVRMDRNNYVIVNFCNSNSGDPAQCAIDQATLTQGLYDYSSIMEYPTQFNSAGVGSITTLSGGTIYPATEVSEYDALGASIMYGAEMEQTTVAIPRNGKSEIFVRGYPDGLIHWATQTVGSPASFTNLGGPNNQPTVGMPSAVSWGPNRIDLFVRGLARDIYQDTYNGTTWSGWKKISNGAASSNPTVASWGVNRLDVFYRGATGSGNGAVEHLYSADGGTTWGADSLGGVARGEPRVISRGPGLLDVVIVQPDSGVYHKGYSTSANAWNPAPDAAWESLSGSALGLATLASPNIDEFDVIDVGRDHALYQRQWTFSKGWAAWVPLDETGVTSAVTATSGTNRFDIFYKGSSQEARHKWNNIGTWEPSESLGGPVEGAPAATQTSAAGFNVFIRNPQTPRELFKAFLGSWPAAWTNFDGTASAPQVYEEY